MFFVMGGDQVCVWPGKVTSQCSSLCSGVVAPCMHMLWLALTACWYPLYVFSEVHNHYINVNVSIYMQYVYSSYYPTCVKMLGI